MCLNGFLSDPGKEHLQSHWVILLLFFHLRTHWIFRFLWNFSTNSNKHTNGKKMVWFTSIVWFSFVLLQYNKFKKNHFGVGSIWKIHILCDSFVWECEFYGRINETINQKTKIQQRQERLTTSLAIKAKEPITKVVRCSCWCIQMVRTSFYQSMQSDSNCEIAITIISGRHKKLCRVRKFNFLCFKIPNSCFIYIKLKRNETKRIEAVLNQLFDVIDYCFTFILLFTVCVLIFYSLWRVLFSSLEHKIDCM